MKIAILTSGFLPVIDGVTVSGMQRLRKLSEWGHEVLLCCPDYSALSHIYPDWQNYVGHILPGVTVLGLKSIPFMGLDFERNVSPSAYAQIMSALKQFRPDIIHVDEPERLFLGLFRKPGVVYARRNKIPCVSFFRTNFLDYVEDYVPLPSPAIAILKYIFRRTILSVYHAYDTTLVSSRVTHEKLHDMGFRNTRYGNLLGFDSEAFRVSSPQADFFVNTYQVDPGQKVTLLFLGRLTPDKGWDFTLAALAQLKISERDQLFILIAGDGPMRDDILTKLAQLKISAHCLGRVLPTAVPMLLANCDLHVTTSTKETRGLTVLEAFAAGTPVLAPNAGGVIENIQDGKNGFLFRPNNVEDFCQKLLQLVGDRELRRAMGQHAQATVARYTWDETVQNLIDIWTDLIEQRAHLVAHPAEKR